MSRTFTPQPCVTQKTYMQALGFTSHETEDPDKTPWAICLSGHDVFRIILSNSDAAEPPKIMTQIIELAQHQGRQLQAQKIRSALTEALHPKSTP
ncbi:MAG: hypothetical protein OJI67_08625 [Prosthecobacter sp.]|nr:hypothetical protein [Prosthecobacter sp.]